jgi:two-component system, chemotaxis family, chemotaxis protein CheY
MGDASSKPYRKKGLIAEAAIADYRRRARPPHRFGESASVRYLFAMDTGDAVILIADDSTTVRLVLRKYLTQLGCGKIIEVTNGVEALATLEEARRRGEPVSVVISDCHMPKMNGIELLGELRRLPEFRSLPFILVTADRESAELDAARTLGIADCLRKPFTVEAVKAALAATVEGTAGNVGK